MTRTGRPTLALLGLVLVLAAVLRFTGLGWGLRHVPHSDERSFVESVAAMIRAGDLDHRFYEYPGLFFDVLYPVQALASPGDPSGPDAYLAARGVIAAFGVASVAIVFLLGARLMSSPAGLAAALLLAVSPLEIRVGHMVHPDVALETLVLLAFLVLAREPPSAAGPGVALGAAAALKFTGVLLIPSYLASRFLEGRLKPRGVAVAFGVAAAVFLLTTPYAVLHWRAFVQGAGRQVGVYYQGRPGAPSFGDNLVFYLGALVEGLGPVGALLAAAGALLAVREWRRFAPLLLMLGLNLAVYSTGELRFQRYMVPVLGIAALLAARALAALPRRLAPIGVLLALVAAAPLLRESVSLDQHYGQPAARDRALDWIEAHVPPGSRILDTVPEERMGYDRHRIEVLSGEPQDGSLRRLLAQDVDFLLTGPGRGSRWGPLETLYQAHGWEQALVLQVRRVPPAAKRGYRRLSLAEARLSASANAGDLPALEDGDETTAWRTPGPRSSSDWVEVRFLLPERVGRLELAFGPDPGPRAWSSNLRILEPAEGGAWQAVPAVNARPPLAGQVTAFRGASQVLLIPARPVEALRILQADTAPVPWEIAELKLDAVVDAGAAQEDGGEPRRTRSPR